MSRRGSNRRGGKFRAANPAQAGAGNDSSASGARSCPERLVDPVARPAVRD
jgi:hypothetical protein